MLLELFYLSEWVIKLGMLVVLTRRRKPVSVMAWLLLVFFLPWVGLVLYLLIGRLKPKGWRMQKQEALRSYFERLRQRLRDHPHMVRPDVEAEAAAAFIERIGSLPVLGGCRVEFSSDADLFLDRLVADIDAARHHVHLLFYIYADDPVGGRVAEALERAAARGVVCRLLVDFTGSRPMLRTLAPRLRKNGVAVQDALPVSLFRRFVGRVDMRNHRKIVVIDGTVGYTGSQNITDPHYGHADLVWIDLMARITGPVVLELQAMFVSDWFMEADELLDNEDLFPDPPLAGESAVQVLPSGPVYPRENFQRLVVAALHHARERVLITTPYLIPDEALLQALETAVLRGVEVVLIVPRRCDQAIPGAAAQSYYEDLLAFGVKVYRFTEGLLHAKTMSVDGHICFFGSSNFDIRSFQINFEVNVVFYSAGEVRWLVAQQEAYRQQSSLLTAEEWGRRPRSARLLQNMARLMSPLL